jgi:hypothetical protein
MRGLRLRREEKSVKCEADAERSRKRGGSLIAIPRCTSDAECGRRHAEVEFMACGKPVILGVHGQAREILEKAQGLR